MGRWRPDRIPAMAEGSGPAVRPSGDLTVGDQRLARHDLLLAEPEAKGPPIAAGRAGTHLLEFARTAPAVLR
jgi:hypothetical protein